jgi:hypothetical protein
MTPSELATATNSPAYAGYVSLLMKWNQTKYDSLKRISGVKLTWPQYLQIEYPDMWAALPEWARDELGQWQFVSPVALASTSQVTPTGSFIPGYWSNPSTAGNSEGIFRNQVQLKDLYYRFTNLDTAESGQFFTVLQSQAPGKIGLPVLNTQGTGQPAQTTGISTSSLIRSRTAKSSGLAGY